MVGVLFELLLFVDLFFLHPIVVNKIDTKLKKNILFIIVDVRFIIIFLNCFYKIIAFYFDYQCYKNYFLKKYCDFN